MASMAPDRAADLRVECTPWSAVVSCGDCWIRAAIKHRPPLGYEVHVAGAGLLQLPALLPSLADAYATLLYVVRTYVLAHAGHSAPEPAAQATLPPDGIEGARRELVTCLYVSQPLLVMLPPAVSIPYECRDLHTALQRLTSEELPLDVFTQAAAPGLHYLCDAASSLIHVAVLAPDVCLIGGLPARIGRVFVVAAQDGLYAAILSIERRADATLHVVLAAPQCVVLATYCGVPLAYPASPAVCFELPPPPAPSAVLEVRMNQSVVRMYVEPSVERGDAIAYEAV